jgi:radical SAM enzyme (TIGR01210 family)
MLPDWAPPKEVLNSWMTNEEEICFMERPLACWEGKDLHHGEVLPSLTLILKTTGCQYNRCRMCGFRHERYIGTEGEPGELILSQLQWVFDHHDLREIQMVKIYTSGSFFDPAEIPPEIAGKVADLFVGKLVVAETRPEYVDPCRIEEFINRIDTGAWDTPLFVAIGLETVSDTVRVKSIDKGFSWQDFLHAAAGARSAGAGIKAYLLHKPPFLTEAEAIDDMKASIRSLGGIADIISMNSCTVQRHTELEYYWKRGAYRPPYLWSVLSILLSSSVMVTCDPVGGGRSRGPHNCGKCDHEIVKAIRTYNLTNDRKILSEFYEMGCGCREEWEFVLSHEMPFSMPLTS